MIADEISRGTPAMQAYWTDPDFDAKFFGVKRPDDVPASIQERAYTSPIWYSP